MKKKNRQLKKQLKRADKKWCLDCVRTRRHATYPRWRVLTRLQIKQWGYIYAHN